MPVLVTLLAVTGGLTWLLMFAIGVMIGVYRKEIFTLLQYARQYLAMYQRMNQRKNLESKG